jgi:lipopolysaccharide/colanic/teichoic acid biosynthesis glycosyltransferase
MSIKRIADILMSTLALAIGLPVLLIVAVVVRVFIGKPVLFRQVRPGRHARPFEMVKFRTMTDARDANGDLLPDGERLTRVGRFLRASSLDELPELWNVLKGEMSFVGPRPLLMDYLPLYDAFQMRRHEVPPGITGWAQVNGRNALSWDEKFAYDIWYIDHQSVWLDLRIMLLTLWRIVVPKGISAQGEATMGRFTGRLP